MPRTMRVSIEEQHRRQQRHRRPKPAIVGPYLGIKYYTNQIQADPTVFVCPHCAETLTSGAFELHCICKHALDARLCCVWCYGSVSWRRWRRKKNHVGHLIACWRSFLAAAASPMLLSPTPAPSSSSSSSANDPLLQPPRIEYVWDLPDRAFELVWLLPVKPHLLTFQDPALKPAVSAVKMFLDHTNSDTSTMTTTTSSSRTTTSNSSRFTTANFSSTSFSSTSFSSTSFSSTSFSSTSYRSTVTGISSSATLHHDSKLPPLEWFHVAVTKQVYEQFLNMMDRYEGDFSTLPYSCWCMTQMDGTCHRHFIVVAKITNEFLKNVHQQHQFGATSIRIARIETVLQLVDTLGDLGNQRRIKNQCPFPSSSSRSDRIHAYYALARLPSDFRLVLLMQWNNGVLQDDLYRELTHTHTNNDRGKRMVDMKLRALNYVSRDDFIPSQYPTGYALHLIWGEKVYFKRKWSDDDDDVARIRPSNALTPAAVLPRPEPGPPPAAAEVIPVGPAAAGPPVKWKRVKLKNFPIQVRLQPRF